MSNFEVMSGEIEITTETWEGATLVKDAVVKQLVLWADKQFNDPAWVEALENKTKKGRKYAVVPTTTGAGNDILFIVYQPSEGKNVTVRALVKLKPETKSYIMFTIDGVNYRTSKTRLYPGTHKDSGERRVYSKKDNDKKKKSKEVASAQTDIG
jgi:hypothetical protein